MSEWIQVKLGGNRVIKGLGLFVTALSLVLFVLQIKSWETPLFLLIIVGICITWLGDCRYLLANTSTKELLLRAPLQHQQSFSITDLTSFTKTRHSILFTLNHKAYRFSNHKRNADWIKFLEENCQLSSDFDGVEQHHFLRISYIRQFLLFLMLPVSLFLLYSLNNHRLLLLLMGLLLLLTLLIHILDCLLITKLFDLILIHSTCLNGRLTSFTRRNLKSGYPVFTYQDHEGWHTVTSLLPMSLTRKERGSYLNREYTLWYAPDESSYVLYGDKEPEPVPAHYFSFTLISQMCIALVFLMILFLATAPTTRTGDDLVIHWASTYCVTPYTQQQIDSDTIQWICASYAISTTCNHTKQGVIGGASPSETALCAQIKDRLNTEYQVTDRSSAIAAVSNLLVNGDRLAYRKAITELNKDKAFQQSRNTYLELVSTYHEDYRYLAIYDAYQSFGEQGIDAWDYCRALELLGECYTCGYLNLEECLDQSLLIARQLQSEFLNWETLSVSYLYGYQYSRKVQTNSTATFYGQQKRAMEHLLTDAHSPYRLNYDIPLIDSWTN